ncbi:hypothetical protein B9Z19DRAFT_1066740 [Tuber borchii]|uniref:Uncharacterized protein n=1 Tax=Tuber borchii TaxID=42251 RepID=A0A2T6ZLA6_TUBBO|nr:hypothetical protein B9Z19DRAFT_1066740 [Tuber borchii]
MFLYDTTVLLFASCIRNTVAKNLLEREKRLYKQRGPTSSLAKHGHIVKLVNVHDDQRLSLQEIANATKVLLSTCSDIIRFSILSISEANIPDPCSDENIHRRPTTIMGQNQALSAGEKVRVIVIALQDVLHYLIHPQIFFLLIVCTTATLSRFKKPFLTENGKAALLV